MVTFFQLIYLVIIQVITTVCAVALFIHVRKIYVKHSGRLDQIDEVLIDVAITQSELATNNETMRNEISTLKGEIGALKSDLAASKEAKRKPRDRVPYQ